MKTLILFLFVLFSVSVFGQDVYEKYNDIQNRYEYFNSSHEMVGYKTYNSIQERWEYHSVEQRQTTRRNKYPDPVSTYNAGLVNKVLASKQARYDNNVADVSRHLDDLTNKLRQYDDYEKEEKAIDMFSEVITGFNNKNNNVDFSSSSITVDVKNYFTTEYNRIIKFVNNMPKKTSTSRNYSNTSNSNKGTANTLFETGFISVPIDIYLRAEPNVSSRKIHKCPKDAIVKVIDISNDTYYKAVVDGYSGYISSALLKRKW